MIECVAEGFQLMLVDVAIQLSSTITTYLAASKHFETAFKIVAPQAAYWSKFRTILYSLFLKINSSNLTNTQVLVPSGWLGLCLYSR